VLCLGQKLLPHVLQVLKKSLDAIEFYTDERTDRQLFSFIYRYRCIVMEVHKTQWFASRKPHAAIIRKQSLLCSEDCDYDLVFQTAMDILKSMQLHHK